MGEIQQTPHVIILSTPGIGHLIPLIEFAKRLVLHHDFSITFTIPTVGPPSTAQKSIFDSLPSSINSIFLPPVNLDDLSSDVDLVASILLSMDRSLSSIRSTIESIIENEHVVALVVDIFGTVAFDLGKEFNLPLYIFFTSGAMTLSLFLQLPKLDEVYSCEYRYVPEPIELPGCIPIHGRDLIDPIQDRTKEGYKRLVHECKKYKLVEGILVNSFVELEAGALKGLSEDPNHPPVYPVGPLIQTGLGSGEAHGSDESGCLKWLDEQPNGSVLFISFGSGGSLSTEQSIELAFGLEMSGQRFIWVVRNPSDKSANATYFTAQSVENPFDFLPKSFLERTRGLGVVVPSWAPQIQILGHGSTGGFLTHCGWNSILESVTHGVPMIAWPLFAEQKMNELLLVDDLKVGLRPMADENGLIGRLEIARVVKGLMEVEEGKELRRKMNNLKNAAANALRVDGISSMSLDEVALRWETEE